MKKFFCILFAISILFSTFTITASAYTTEFTNQNSKILFITVQALVIISINIHAPLTLRIMTIPLWAVIVLTLFLKWPEQVECP